MSTPIQLMALSAAVLNDTERAIFTDEVLLPYFNMALLELQEIFELNNVPVTNETSAVIEIDAGTPGTITTIGFGGLAPNLPSDLIEIRNLWESPRGLSQYTPVVKKDFIPQYLINGTQISQFLLYSWADQKINVISANADNDLKIDYVKSLFVEITDLNGADDLGIINTDTYLYNRCGALAAYFIGENPERYDVLTGQADAGLLRSLGISAKGRQSIVTRRRPYRQSYKLRGATF